MGKSFLFRASLTTRGLTATGLAATALAGLLAAAPPAFARPVSTRAEQEETRQLNLQQAALTQQNAPAQAPVTDAAAQLADNAPPAAAPTQPVQTAAIQAAAADNGGGEALAAVANPPQKVATANVVDAKGSMVGAVQKVTLDASGKPSRVDVSLMGTDVIVAMDASKFRYDPASNVLTAQMDAHQIAEEPRAPQG